MEMELLTTEFMFSKVSYKSSLITPCIYVVMCVCVCVCVCVWLEEEGNGP